MKAKVLTRILRVLSIALLAIPTLAACQTAGGQVANISVTGLHVWLDQPPDGARLPLAPFTLKAHAGDESGSGVVKITFLVNTIGVGSVDTDPGQPLAYAELPWNPAAPGSYQIQAQAFDSAGSALSEIANVCVGDACQAAEAATQDTTPQVTEAATEAATQPPAPQQTEAVTQAPPQQTEVVVTQAPPPQPTEVATEPPQPTEVATEPPADNTPPEFSNIGAKPNPVYYGDSCGPNDPKSFTVSASVSDPSGLKSVKLFFQYVSTVNKASSGWQSVGMPGGGTRSATVTLDTNSIYKVLQGTNGYVEYYITARDKAGNEGSSQHFTDINLLYCIG